MQNPLRTKLNTEIVEWHAGYYNFELEYLNGGHQLRLTDHSGKRLDYYPKSGQATWVGTNVFFNIPDIEKYLETNIKLLKK